MYIVQFVTTVVVDAESGEQAANIAVQGVKATACDILFSEIKQVEVSKSINYRNFYEEAMEPRHFLKAEYWEEESHG